MAAPQPRQLQAALAIVSRPTAKPRLDCRKIQIAVNEQPLKIRAVEVTSNTIGDAPVLPDLLNQIAQQEKSACVTADGACDTSACHDAIAARGALTVISPRKTARLWKPATGGTKAR
jgi:2-keto-3-deoxy-6-phosphogluconate aldolase